MKKIVSLLLSFIMLLSITAGMTFESSASSIQTITFGQEVLGECGYKEHSYYQFTVPVSGEVTFNITGTTYRSYNKYKDDFQIQIYESPYNMQEYNYDYILHAYYSEAFDYGIAKEKINLKTGTYYIRTDAYCSSGNSYDYYDYSILLTYKPNICKPSNFKVSTRNVNSLKLSWKKVSGASGYQLQQKKSGKWTTLKNTTSNAYTVSKLKAGTSYQFRVRTYKTISGKKYYSSWVTLTTPTRPSTVTLSSLKSNKSKQLTVKWKKTTGTGYQVQYSTSSKFTNAKTVTVSKNSTTSKTISKLKGKKKYYVRVRAYKTVNGTKYCGAWSKTKAVTTKK